jgi:predicted Ser/Thr protein kinase
VSKLGRIGPYTLLTHLGRGGMGEVYLAANRRGDRVALKMLREPVEEDAEARLRLEREVRALRRVESPYVARVLDADLSGARPYLVMEHVEGETLLERVRGSGPLDGPPLLALAQGIATALAIIHAAGVVHRDLKPANVLVASDGPVLIDFGIAQMTDATRVTMTGTFLGTPGYAAPEVFAGELAGEPADVHAWGATVAFASTGRPTFGGGTAEAQMYAILNGKADLAGVSAALLPLVRAALNRDPAKRPTAALLADRLARLARAARLASPDATDATDDATDDDTGNDLRGTAGQGGPAAPAAAVRARRRTATVARTGLPAEDVPAARKGRSAAGAPQGRTVRSSAGTGAERPGKSGADAGAKGTRTEQAAGSPLPPGSGALFALALLSLPCVVASVIWPLATFGITLAFGTLARAVWIGHWLVRKRRSARTRRVLRGLSLPLTLVASLPTVAIWPGLPAAGAGGLALWLASGAEIGPGWWQEAGPLTVAAVVFGVICGGILGREVERVTPGLPDLRSEWLRALAVLGGFVALCAAAVRAIALLF